LLPLLRWAWGPLSVPCKPGTPRTSSKSRRRARRALATPPPWCQLSPPGSGQLRCCHMSHDPSSRVPAWGSSGAATHPVTPAPASWHRAAPEPSRVSWLQLPPPGSGQLRSRHVSHGSSSRLLARGSSRVVMCPVALAPSSWLRAALEPPHVPWSSTGCGLLKQTNIPRWHCRHDLPSGHARIFRGVARQVRYRAHARHAVGGKLNANKMCGQGVCRTATGQRRSASHSQQATTV
jgi:hypothetical protein